MAERTDHHFLCRAWGETDLTCAAICRDMTAVRQFLIDEWLGEEDSPDWEGEPILPGVMDEIAAYDWQGEGNLWQTKFEIGGLSIERVFAARPVPAPPAPVPALEGEPTDTQLLNLLASESWDLRCFSMPTGQGDADIGWQVVGHFMGAPKEREIGIAYRDDPREALRDAYRYYTGGGSLYACPDARIAHVAATPPAASPAPAGQTGDLQAVLRFLLGEAPLDGRWFGEAKDGARYWWRTNLRAVMPAGPQDRDALVEALISKVESIAGDFVPDRDQDAPLALSEMRTALQALVAEALSATKGATHE